MEQNKIFLDTNIVADLIDASRSNHALSLALLRHLVLNSYDICISEDMVTTLYYILKDKENALKFLENVVFVDWSVLIFGTSVLQKAVKVSSQKYLDLEDVLQCLCAKENGCKIMITNDKRFYDCGLSIYTTEEFLKQYED